jgi:cell division GTPase FtsZ
MSATSNEEKVNPENIVNDLESKVEAPKVEASVDLNKLAALKAKQAALTSQANNAKPQENTMSAKLVAKKDKSIKLGIIGTGQAGSRIAETFYQFGYNAIALNTATQDLKFIGLPDDNKLLLDNGIGGSAKDLSIGEESCLAHKGEILQLINDKLADVQISVLCTSLGGGSGAGSVSPMIEILSTIGKPIVVICCLPMDNEDLAAKKNSLETLSKLASFSKSGKIANLIVIDNAKIEHIYSNVGQFDFFNVANKSIVKTLDSFNTLSSMPSKSKSFDAMEWSRAFLDGNSLSCYGEFKVKNYEEDTAIAEAVVNNLSNNLLAEGFDLAQAKYVGFIVTANEKVWSKIPASSINYATSMVNDLCQSSTVYKGFYITEDTEDCVCVLSYFSGLNLPGVRIEQLKTETDSLTLKAKDKEVQRNINLQIDSGQSETINSAQAIKNKIAAKSSTFGKFVNSVSDRRK